MQARYQIQRLLGAGGMGSVYLAEDRKGQGPLALKFLHENPELSLALFQEEVQILSHLSHPNLIKILDYHPAGSGLWKVAAGSKLSAAEIPTGPFFTMEYIPGHSLETQKQGLTTEAWVSNFAQLCQGLHYLHARNILHRDLKPSNVMQTESGEIKLLDFGLAKVQAGGSSDSTPRGTLGYLPPEAYWGDYETRSDLFSLGVLCYECLTGRLPYASFLGVPRAKTETPPPLHSLRPDLPEYFCSAVDRLLALNPDRRPASALSVLRYLNQHLETPLPLLAGEGIDTILQKLPLVGREKKMRDFWETVARHSRASATPMILVTGPTGSGRSRFLEEAKWPLQLEGFRYLSVAASDQASWREDILLGLGIAEQSPLVPDFAERVFSAAAQHKTVLVFQDLQEWSSGSLREFLLFLKISRRGPANLLLVLERNSDLPSPDLDALFAAAAESPQTTQILLEDLEPAACRGLLQSAPLEKPLPSTIVEALIADAGGRPLLLLELLRHYLSTGKLAAKLEHQATQDLREVAQLRIQGLNDGSRLLLALVTNHPFPCFAVQLPELWKLENFSWQDSLLELDRQGFTKPRSLSQAQVQLAQPSLQAIYLEVLPEKVVHQAHGLWIQYLKNRLGDKPRSVPEGVALAEHAYQAEQKDLAKPWGMAAAEYYEGQNQVTEALRWYQRLLPWAETGEERYILHGSAAPLLYRLGRFDEALEAYHLWFQDRPDDETRLQKAKHYFYTGLVLFHATREAEAQQAFAACLDIGGRGKVPSHRHYHARSLAFLSALEEKQNRLAAARSLLQEALAIATGNDELLGEIERRLGEVDQSQLQYEAAFGHFKAALAHFHQAKSPNRLQGQSVVLQNLAMIENECGRPTKALLPMEEALALARSGGQILQWAYYQQNQSLIFLDLAEYASAQNAMERSAEIIEVLGTEDDKLLVQLHHAEFYLRVGNFQRVTRILGGLEKSRDKLTARGRWPRFLSVQGELAYFQGHFAESQRSYEEAAALAHNSPRNLTELHAEIGACRALAQQNLLDSKQPALVSALAKLAGISQPFFKIWKDTLEIISAPELEIPHLQLLESLLSRLEGLEMPELALEGYRLLAVSLQRQGLQRSALRCHAAGQATLSKIYQRLPEELKMDFEKNRNLEAWDQALSDKIVAQPEIPAAQTPIPPTTPTPVSPMPTSTASTTPQISEQRFRQYSEISRQISQKNNLTEILERVMDAAIELTGAERGFLLLRNEAAKKKPMVGFEVKTARHINHQSLSQEDLQISMTAVKQAMDQGTTLLTGNAQLDPRLQQKKSVVQFQLKAILVVPLELEGRVVGAIYLDHRYHPSCFNEEDLVFLNAFAAQASLAIQKAQLIEELNQAKEKLEVKVEDQAQHIEVLSGELAKVRDQLRYGYDEIVGQSPAMMEVFHLLDHVTETLIPVWIHGESGTGKELVARSLHVNSPRKSRPFVAQNCSAIPESLLESELFGHKKGAFTHADRDRIGLFEQANEGTLFLDEVADMSLNMQVKLLRVLQEGEVRPLGGTKNVKVDVRLVTASNKDLEQLVAEEKFRQDLFFRINGITIRLPALRERKEDIPLLTNYLIQKVARDFKLKPSEVSDKAFNLIVDYPWPGNIRQLEGVLRNALLFAKGRTITPEFLSISKSGVGSTEKKDAAASTTPAGDKKEERHLILDSLRKNKMNKRLAAQELGISLRSLYMRMDRHGIPKNKPVLAKFLGLKA